MPGARGMERATRPCPSVARSHPHHLLRLLRAGNEGQQGQQGGGQEQGAGHGVCVLGVPVERRALESARRGEREKKTVSPPGGVPRAL